MYASGRYDVVTTGRFLLSASLVLAIAGLAPACSKPEELPAAAAVEAPASTPDSDNTAATRVVAGKAPAGAILLLEPRTPREFPDPVDKPVMDQVSQTFTPDVLFVRTGQPVEFLNSDDTLHNINVRDDATKEQAFNVAIPTGATYAFTFKRDGLYNVRCDIHPAMSALIVASATPYAVMGDNDGNFVFDAVAPGAYTLTVYAGTDKITKDVDVLSPRTDIVIDRGTPPH